MGLAHLCSIASAAFTVRIVLDRLVGTVPITYENISLEVLKTGRLAAKYYNET